MRLYLKDSQDSQDSRDSRDSCDSQDSYISVNVEITFIA